MKNHFNSGIRPDLYFWADSSGYEIDLIVHAGSKILSVEIKSADTVRSEHFKNLELFQKISGVSADNCYLIYGGAEAQNRTKARVRGWKDLAELI